MIEARRSAPRATKAAVKAPPPPPVRPATEELRRLEELRQRNGGLLVPQPPGIGRAQLEGATNTANSAMRDAWTWLQAIGEIGGGQDLQLAWETWRLAPGLPASVNPKLHFLAQFEVLQATAGRRYAELVARAEQEGRQERIVESLRRQLKSERAEADAAYRDYEVAAGKMRKTESALEAAERRVNGDLQ